MVRRMRELGVVEFAPKRPPLSGASDGGMYTLPTTDGPMRKHSEPWTLFLERNHPNAAGQPD